MPHHFRNEGTLNIMFADKKMHHLDGMLNAQNDCVRALARRDVDKKGGIQQKRKFSQKMMIWLKASSHGLTQLIVFRQGTLDHQRYIKNILPVTSKYGNDVFGVDWTLQQDDARPHMHHLLQTWFLPNFPSLIEKDHWPPNSCSLNLLDSSMWDEFNQQMIWDKVTTTERSEANKVFC